MISKKNHQRLWTAMGTVNCAIGASYNYRAGNPHKSLLSVGVGVANIVLLLYREGVIGSNDESSTKLWMDEDGEWIVENDDSEVKRR